MKKVAMFVAAIALVLQLAATTSAVEEPSWGVDIIVATTETSDGDFEGDFEGEGDTEVTPPANPPDERVIEAAETPPETSDPEIPVFTPLETTMYCGSDVGNVRAEPSTDAAVVGRVTQHEAVKVTGTNGEWFRVEFNGETAYINRVVLTDVEPPESDPEPDPENPTDPPIADPEPPITITPEQSPAPEPQPEPTPDVSDNDEPENVPAWSEENNSGNSGNTGDDSSAGNSSGIQGNLILMVVLVVMLIATASAMPFLFKHYRLKKIYRY
ncbi:MAG: SH3 domain-containing protein [Oscillospiraceae bacterium]|nr:SH3 domain-containing protein [Oscillospiraceae bacterium]